MERDKESPLLGYPTNGDDLKYVSSLSTILVATIQEAKDRISQVEYIFCSQLFPNFQSKSKCLQKVYFEARKAAEDEWKEKEHDLLLQIKNLQLEKQLILEENQSFEMEKLKILNQQESFKENLPGLKEELKQKTEEIEKLREMQLNMVKALEAKSSLMANNEKIMKQLEEKNRNLIAKYETLEKTVDIIEEQLNQKAKEVDTEKDLKKKLFEDIESLRLQKYDYEQILNRSETEKKQLEDQLHILEGTIAGLQKEPCKKTEVAAGKKFQEQLLQQIDLHNSEMSKNRQQVEEYEKEKKLHLAKIKSLEDRIDKFRVDLREKGEVTTEGIQLHKKLLEQIEAKNSELFSEKKKRKDMVTAYKSLKSQFNYLCTKFSLDTESLLPDNRMDNDSSSFREDPNPSTSRAPNATIVACNSIKEEIHEDTKGMRSIQRSSSNSPSGANNPGPNQRGTKRPGSSWRDTRSHQRRNGPDPHDDFLDTPLECIRENIKNPLRDEMHNPPDPVPHEMNFESLDDETQDLGGNPVKQNPQMPAPRPAMNGFKYVEPVRKKADRENLKGIECNQCRKFYDAVLPDDGGDGNKQQLRCEHHQGVSRHRYRYAPPSTPEGFWNIGFESEM